MMFKYVPYLACASPCICIFSYIEMILWKLTRLSIDNILEHVVQQVGALILEPVDTCNELCYVLVWEDGLVENYMPSNDLKRESEST